MVSGTFTRCSLWPMGYKVCSRLLVLFSYSVEVLGGLCLFVYFDYSARILSHDSFTKRVLSRQFFLLSLLDRLEDVCFVPLECRWRQSKGTSTANILNCGAFCPLSAAGDRPGALQRQYLELWGFLPFECRWRSSRGTSAAIKP